jgi:hypothetical protein
VSGAAFTAKAPWQVLKALGRVEDQQAELRKKHEARGGQMHFACPPRLARKEMAAKLDTLGQADVLCVARSGEGASGKLRAASRAGWSGTAQRIGLDSKTE